MSFPALCHPFPLVFAAFSEYIKGCIPWLYKLSGFNKLIILNLYNLPV